MSLPMLEEIRRLFTYDAWANLEAAQGLARAAAPPERARKILAHIVGADRLWLERLQPTGAKPDVWPELSPSACSEGMEEVARSWETFLDRLAPAGLERVIPYRNSKGEEWSGRVQDILMHVVMHSAYHRGQVASEMRGAGQTPACTDFIHSVRQGHLDQRGVR